MANSIILKAKAFSELDEHLAFSVALALNNGDMDIPATFSITSEADTLPMIGITEYGKLVGLVDNIREKITIKANGPAGIEESVSVSVNDIININVGSALVGMG